MLHGSFKPACAKKVGGKSTPLTGSDTTRPAVAFALATGTRMIKGAATEAWYGPTLDLNPC